MPAPSVRGHLPGSLHYYPGSPDRTPLEAPGVFVVRNPTVGFQPPPEVSLLSTHLKHHVRPQTANPAARFAQEDRCGNVRCHAFSGDVSFVHYGHTVHSEWYRSKRTRIAKMSNRWELCLQSQFLEIPN